MPRVLLYGRPLRSGRQGALGGREGSAYLRTFQELFGRRLTLIIRGLCGCSTSLREGRASWENTAMLRRCILFAPRASAVEVSRRVLRARSLRFELHSMRAAASLQASALRSLRTSARALHLVRPQASGCVRDRCQPLLPGDVNQPLFGADGRETVSWLQREA